MYLQTNVIIQLTFINISILILYIISIGKTLFMHKIATFAFDVGIDDSNELTSGARQVVHHVLGVGKLNRIPGEVLLSISVLNVQPHDVDRHVVGVKVFDDRSDIVFIVVVPSALMICQSKVLKENIFFLFIARKNIVVALIIKKQYLISMARTIKITGIDILFLCEKWRRYAANANCLLQEQECNYNINQCVLNLFNDGKAKEALVYGGYL